MHLFFFVYRPCYVSSRVLFYLITLFEQNCSDSTFTDMNCYCFKFNFDVVFFVSLCVGLYFVIYRVFMLVL